MITYPCRKLIIIFLITFLFLACDDDDQQSNPIIWENCLLNESLDTLTYRVQCTLFSADLFCDSIVYNNSIPMTPSTLAWMPYYCATIGDRIYFKNEKGKFDFARVINKEYREVGVSYAEKECPDSIGNLLHCEVRQRTIIELDIQPLNRSFSIELEGPGYSSYSNEENSFFRLWSRDEDDNHRNHGGFQLDSTGSLEEGGEYIPDIIHERLSIGGYSFSDVVELIGIDSEPEKNNFFYSKHYGIVSFTDDDGEQWIYLK